MSERARPLVVADEEALAKIIRSVTDKWDEPLDEVHDVPQIVNALIAAGVVQTRAQVVAALAEKWSGCWCGPQQREDHDPRVRDCPQHGSDDCRHMAEGIVIDIHALAAPAEDTGAVAGFAAALAAPADTEGTG